MLEAGDVAPEFTLLSQTGAEISLGDYAGRYVLVWWIPSTMQEMTPACCDKVAKGFASETLTHPELNVIGLSFDSPEMMASFAQRAMILFPLLSDESKAVGEAYGVRRGEGRDWDSFPMKRAFLIGPNGLIEKVYKNIDPEYFVPEVLADLTGVST